MCGDELLMHRNLLALSADDEMNELRSKGSRGVLPTSLEDILGKRESVF